MARLRCDTCNQGYLIDYMDFERKPGCRSCDGTLILEQLFQGEPGYVDSNAPKDTHMVNPSWNKNVKNAKEYFGNTLHTED